MTQLRSPCDGILLLCLCRFPKVRFVTLPPSRFCRTPCTAICTRPLHKAFLICQTFRRSKCSPCEFCFIRFPRKLIVSVVRPPRHEACLSGFYEAGDLHHRSRAPATFTSITFFKLLTNDTGSYHPICSGPTSRGVRRSRALAEAKPQL